MFEIITDHFWAVLIVVTCANAAYFKYRSQYYIEANPTLAQGYSRLIRGYLFWLNIPWVVMGVGCTIGGIPSTLYYLNPNELNPYVLAWFGSVFMLWILGSIWLFFRGGAETLVKYPGAVQVHSPFARSRDIMSPLAIKLLWCLCMASGVFGVYMMWTQKIPTP